MKTLLSLLLFLFAISLQAQVQVTIIDQSSGRPLDQVRVTAPSTVQTSSATGVLIFAGDNLRLVFEREGYERLEKTFPAGDFTVSMLPDVLNLSQVTVTAFDSERPLLQQAAAVSRVSERDLFRFNESSPVQAFNQKAGIRIEERAPASYRISIRGSSLRSPFGVRNVKVYWNDVPFTSPDGTTPLNLLDLSNIKTAEVIKGPSGSVYGAGNGGAISLFSQAQVDENRISADYLMGDFGLSRYRLGISQQLGDGGFEASYARQESDGYRDHSGVKRQVVQLSGYFPVSEKQELRTQVLISDLNYQIPGALTEAQLTANPKQARPGSVGQNSSIDQQALLLSLGHTYRHSDQLTSTTTVYLNTNAFENPFILDYKKELGFGYGARSKVRYDTQLGGKSLRLLTGGEWQKSITQAQNFGNRAGKADTVRFADQLTAYQGFLFQQAELQWNSKLLFTLGLSENFSGFEIDRQVDAAGGKTGLQTRKFDPILVPRLAANYQFNPYSSVYGSISSGFSPPTIDEVRTNEGSVNLSLEAEKGLNYELGYRLGKERFNLELIAYYFKLQETITSYTNPNGVVLFQNAGATNQKGVEASLDYSFLRNGKGFVRDFLLGTAYTGQFFTFDNYQKRGQDFSGNALTGVPAHNVVSRLDVRTRPGVYLNFTHQFTEEIPLNDANTIYQDAYSLVNLRVGWIKQLGSWELELFAGIDNLLDVSYSLGNDLNAFAGRFYQPAPTRNGYGGVKVGWKY